MNLVWPIVIGALGMALFAAIAQSTWLSVLLAVLAIYFSALVLAAGNAR